MLKRIAVCVLATGALVASTGGTAVADPGTNNGQGNGAVGCTLTNGTEYKNPGEMLKYLTWRDGSFQNTVDRYFTSVADLIDQKCGA